MKKISDNFFDEVYSEMGIDKEASMEKSAFDISISPGSIIGALTGAAIANKKAKEDILKRNIENENSRAISGNYYSQVDNLAKNLKIIFTPLSVVYVVKNGASEITIETINTEEMSPDMQNAWRNKDYEYFRNLLLNKMSHEIQMVEQMFAKNIIQRQLDLSNRITKRASAENIPEDMTILEMMEHVAQIKDFYSKQSPVIEKLADILYKLSEDDDTYVIRPGFDRPIEKYAFFGNKLSFLGIRGNSSDIRALQGDYLSPRYLKNRVKVGFLPDRIVFVVDNKVISTLLAMDMDEAAFKKFQTQDKFYFMKMFAKQLSLGVERMKGKGIPIPKPINISPEVEKTAEDNSQTIFTMSDIHPLVYAIVLRNKYGKDWTDLEPVSLIKMIEDDFNLDEGIDDVPLNKILSVIAANKGALPYTSSLAFEKIIRSFVSKPVDFERKETDITGIDITTGLIILDAITPDDDILDNFSPDIEEYIAQILLNSGFLIYLPQDLIDLNYGGTFCNRINKILFRLENERDTDKAKDKKEENFITKINGAIANTSRYILSAVRKTRASGVRRPDDEIVENMLKDLNLKTSVKDSIKEQVMNNVLIDRGMQAYDDILATQVEKYKTGGDK